MLLIVQQFPRVYVDTQTRLLAQQNRKMKIKVKKTRALRLWQNMIVSQGLQSKFRAHTAALEFIKRLELISRGEPGMPKGYYSNFLGRYFGSRGHESQRTFDTLKHFGKNARQHSELSLDTEGGVTFKWKVVEKLPGDVAHVRFEIDITFNTLKQPIRMIMSGGIETRSGSETGWSTSEP